MQSWQGYPTVRDKIAIQNLGKKTIHPPAHLCSLRLFTLNCSEFSLHLIERNSAQDWCRQECRCPSHREMCSEGQKFIILHTVPVVFYPQETDTVLHVCMGLEGFFVLVGCLFWLAFLAVVAAWSPGECDIDKIPQLQIQRRRLCIDIAAWKSQ